MALQAAVNDVSLDRGVPDATVAFPDSVKWRGLDVGMTE